MESTLNKSLADNGINLVRILRDEKYRMELALRYSGSHNEAILLLDMARMTYFRKMKKYELKNPRK